MVIGVFDRDHTQDLGEICNALRQDLDQFDLICQSWNPPTPRIVANSCVWTHMDYRKLRKLSQLRTLSQNSALRKTCESVVWTELVTTKSRFDAGIGTQVNLNIALLPLRIDFRKTHYRPQLCVGPCGFSQTPHFFALRALSQNSALHNKCVFL